MSWFSRFVVADDSPQPARLAFDKLSAAVKATPSYRIIENL
jgi:hypothetical protein